MSLTSYRAAPPRVTMWAECQPGSMFVAHSDGVGLDGGLLHPASPFVLPQVPVVRSETLAILA